MNIQDEIITLYYQNYSWKEIAKRVNLSVSYCQSMKSKLNLKSRDRVRPPYAEEAIKLYNEGSSIKELSAKFNKTPSTIRYMLKQCNVPIRSYIQNTCIRNNLDFTFFEKIDCEEKAYILGLLYADGWVRNYEVGIELRDYDLDILKKVKSSLNCLNKITPIIQKYNNKLKYCFRICSKKYCEDLVKLGCVKNKSLKLQWPTNYQVPEKYLHHFIRGYFDGDGSVSIYKNNIKVNFSGFVDFITSLRDYLSSINIVPSNKLNFGKDKVRRLFVMMEWSGKKNLQSLYKYMYSDATIYGIRKKKKFEEIICAINEKSLIETGLIAGTPETVISSQASIEEGSSTIPGMEVESSDSKCPALNR